MEKILPYKIGDKIGDREVIDIIKIKQGTLLKLKCKCGKEIKRLVGAIKRIGACKYCKIKSFEGTKQGKLTFLKHMGLQTWEARCDCGITKLVQKHYKSCGCEQYNRTNRTLEYFQKTKELIGLKHNKLKIIDVKLIGGSVFLECICVCGSVNFYIPCKLFRIKSCGCEKHNLVHMRGENHNNSKHKNFEIIALKELYFSGICSIKELCKIFNIRNSEIYGILREEEWKNAKVSKDIKKIPVPKKKIRRKFTVEELEGKTFGNQTILEILDKSKITVKSLVLVKCHCGNIRKIKLCTVIYNKGGCFNRCKNRTPIKSRAKKA